MPYTFGPVPMETYLVAKFGYVREDEALNAPAE